MSRTIMMTIEVGIGIPESAIEGMDMNNLSFEDTMELLKIAMKNPDKNVYHTDCDGTYDYKDKLL